MPYIITEKTVALISQGKNTKIIEYYNLKKTAFKSIDIVNYNCKIHGSTLEGRLKASAYLIGASYKPPILIQERPPLIFLTTHSIRNQKCIWLNLAQILNYKVSKSGVNVKFKNNQHLLLKVSYEIFDKQVLRATRLESTIRGRINKKFL